MPGQILCSQGLMDSSDLYNVKNYSMSCRTFCVSGLHTQMAPIQLLLIQAKWPYTFPQCSAVTGTFLRHHLGRGRSPYILDFSRSCFIPRQLRRLRCQILSCFPDLSMLHCHLRLRLLATMCELENSAFDMLTENSLLTFTPALPLDPKHHSWDSNTMRHTRVFTLRWDGGRAKLIIYN